MIVLSDSPIHKRGDLAAILPPEVAARISPDLLREPYTAPALRIFATIRDERIWEHVGEFRIDWNGMLTLPGLSSSVSLRLQIAYALSQWAFGGLDADNYAAVLDAVHIAREGLEP